MLNSHSLVFLGALLAGALLVLPLAAVGRRIRRADGDTARDFDFTGVVTVVAAWIALAIAGALRQDPETVRMLQAVVPWGAAVMLVGVVVDARGLPRYLRTAAILIAAVAVAQRGVSIETYKLPFSELQVSLGLAAPVITTLWLLVMSALFGRAATIPGVPAGVGAAAGATFYVICSLRPDLTSPGGALFAALLAGVCLPQVPAAPRLSGGNATSGGYVIGFFVGIASITGALKNTAFLVSAVPLIIVGAPLFAAVCTYASDLRSGVRAIAQTTQRQHLHDILRQQGYTPAQVLRLILAGTVYLCALAILLVLLITVTFVVKLLLILVAVVAGLALFYVLLRMMRRPGAVDVTGRPRTVQLLGVKLDAVTMPQALAEAERFIRENRPHMIVTTDASGFMRAQDDPEFRQIVNQADLVTPDGAGVVLAARLLNVPLEARCAGCDMVTGLCQVAAKLGRSVYLLGAAPGVAEEAAEKLRQAAPGLQIAGCRDGYFQEHDEPGIIEEIRRTKPAVLFVALGIPRQEKWIRSHLQELGVPVCVGIGGSFDVISGRKKRAPVWMQRTGLEWLYRAAKEPQRIPRLAALPRIVLLTFRELLRPPERHQ